MTPKYKRVKIAMPHCPVCEEQLLGNNSIVSPWNCKCGIWQAIPQYPWNGQYQIVSQPKI